MPPSCGLEADTPGDRGDRWGCCLCCGHFLNKLVHAPRVASQSVSCPGLSCAPPRPVGSAGTGWICYAEKTHGSFILPYLSTARSPQQVMGSLVKDFFAQQQVTALGSEHAGEWWLHLWPWHQSLCGCGHAPSGGIWGHGVDGSCL